MTKSTATVVLVCTGEHASCHNHNGTTFCHSIHVYWVVPIPDFTIDFAVIQMMTGPCLHGIYSQVTKTGIAKTTVKINIVIPHYECLYER